VSYPEELLIEILKGTDAMQALVDVWSLSLASRITDPVTDKSYDTDCISSLMLLLDAFALSDRVLIVDYGWPFGVRERLGGIAAQFEKVDTHGVNREHVIQAANLMQLEDALKSKHDETIEVTEAETRYGAASLVRESVGLGGIYYLSLARVCGATYWPAPRRAAYLSKFAFDRKSPNVASLLQDAIDLELRKIIDEAVELFGINSAALTLPTLGSSMLQECSTPEELWSVAQEFRTSQPAMQFREWSKALEAAVIRGDVRVLASAISDIRDVAEEIGKKLTGKSNKYNSMSITVGLSPSISFSRQNMRSLFGNRADKRSHVAFLRNHMNSALACADTRFQVDRIFGVR
jgi:hypothetical protein